MKQFLFAVALLVVSLPYTSSWAQSEEDVEFESGCVDSVFKHTDRCARFELKKTDKSNWLSRFRMDLDKDNDGVLDFFDADPKNICRYQDCDALEGTATTSCRIEELSCEKEKINCALTKLLKSLSPSENLQNAMRGWRG